MIFERNNENVPSMAQPHIRKEPPKKNVMFRLNFVKVMKYKNFLDCPFSTSMKSTTSSPPKNYKHRHEQTL